MIQMSDIQEYRTWPEGDEKEIDDEEIRTTPRVQYS